MILTDPYCPTSSFSHCHSFTCLFTLLYLKSLPISSKCHSRGVRRLAIPWTSVCSFCHCSCCPSPRYNALWDTLLSQVHIGHIWCSLELGFVLRCWLRKEHVDKRYSVNSRYPTMQSVLLQLSFHMMLSGCILTLSPLALTFKAVFRCMDPTFVPDIIAGYKETCAEAQTHFYLPSG